LGGVEYGRGPGTFCSDPDAVSGIETSLSGVHYVKHDFVLTYLNIKGTNLQHFKDLFRNIHQKL
jgi:hypothetical protein